MPGRVGCVSQRKGGAEEGERDGGREVRTVVFGGWSIVAVVLTRFSPHGEILDCDVGAGGFVRAYDSDGTARGAAGLGAFPVL